MSNLIQKEIISKSVEVISLELSKTEKTNIENTLLNICNSKEFKSELDKVMNKNDEVVENELDVIICILLGLGRNRTIKVLDSTRTAFENVRDKYNLLENNLRKLNEKKITNLKWSYNKRLNRDKALSHLDWSLVREEYLSGLGISALAKKYKVQGHYISDKLHEEGILDEYRSTIAKKEIADEKYESINDDYIIKLVENNPMTPKNELWRLAQEKYSWLLRRQFYNKLDKLNLTRTKDEVNEIRRIKSKGESNHSYQVKQKGYRAVKDVFGSVDKLVKLYMENSLGSYTKIANMMNEKVSFDHKISSRQVEKIISRNENYVPRKSSGQKQLYEFIKSTFPNETVIEEYTFQEGSQKKIDIYIPSMKVGFEFNGEYWHSDSVINYNYGLSSYEFHKKRKDSLKSKNINLLYVWEDDWNHKYDEVESAIKNKRWDSEILNKKEGNSNRKFSSPDKIPSLLRNQTLRFLKEKNIHFTKKNNSNLIFILDENLIINIPNYSSLANKKETLKLQKYYEEEGIELITVLPWRDIGKLKEYLSYRLNLKSIRKVPARKCDVIISEKITDEQKNFFESNHLLGYEYNFRNVDKVVSLSYNGETVISALFTRKPNSPQSELKRLVSSYGISVQGGASRLLKSYIRNSESLEEIMTYSDCDLGFGSVYNVLGFKLIKRSEEQLTWFHPEHLRKFSNRSLVMVGADRLLKNHPNYISVGMGDGLPSNQEIVQGYGFIPIYDSGYKKWIYKLDS